MSSLTVVIVNYNQSHLILKCLNTLYLSLHPSTQVIVIDNHSTDDSVKQIKKNFPQVRLIQNDHNLGFSKANNQGITRAKTEYILLLNSDTQIKPGSINSLVSFMDQNPNTAVASPRLLNPDGSTQLNGGSLPRLSTVALWGFFIDDLPLIGKLLPSYHRTNPAFFETTRPVGWISAAVMIIRASVLKKTGLLDENIFMYGEDTEFCYRVSQHRYQIYTVSESQVIHHGQGSSTSYNALTKEFPSLVYLFQKHKPVWELPILKLILKISAMLRVILFDKIYHDEKKATAYRQALELVR